MLHLLKLLGLFTFVGGPLYVSDLLKPRLGNAGAFAVGFAPLALMLFAWLTALDEKPEGFAATVVRLGLVGAAGLLAMNLFAAACLLSGRPYSEPGLIWLGIGVGCLAVGLFIRQVRQFLDR